MAQKPHVPTEELKLKVEAAACTGANQKLIAKYIGIDEDTLVKYYGDILEMATLEKNINVSNSLYFNCTVKNNVTAQIFWLKCRARWKENPDDVDTRTPESVNINFTVQQPVGEIKVTKGKDD